jgi:hypothetical protein
MNMRFVGDEYPVLSDMKLRFNIVQQYLDMPVPLRCGKFDPAYGGMHWFGGTPVSGSDFSFTFDASTNLGLSVMRRSDYWPDFTLLFRGNMKVTRLLDPTPNAGNYGTDVDSTTAVGIPFANANNEWSVVVMDPISAPFGHWGIRVERDDVGSDFVLLGAGCFSNGINY